MNWSDAFEILKPIPTEDYVGGAWNPIRLAKCKAFFELAQQVKAGVIVELGTFRGLGAIALSLGASVPVYTVDSYEGMKDFLSVQYSPDDRFVARENIDRAAVKVTRVLADVRDIGSDWVDPVSLLVWDLGIKGRLKDDIAAWIPKLTDDALVVVKDLETGEGFGRDELLELGFQQVQAFPDGAVYAYQRKPQTAGHVIWIVDGDKYVAEAERSAASVKRHMPELTPCIYQPNKRVHAEWFIESTRLLVKALEGLPDGAKVLWLDSDTYMLESVSDLFETLEYYDMVLAHAPGHKTGPTMGPIPDCFPELNIGVIAMENNEDVRILWESIYDMQREESDIYGNNDQAPLRESLWSIWEDESVKYVVMPSEYNFRFQFGGQVRDRVKILHGHADSAATYEAIGASVNAGWTEGYQVPPRLWSPDVLR